MKPFLRAIPWVFVATMLLSTRVIAKEGLTPDETPVRISPAVCDDRGIQVHDVVSPFQSTPTKIRVLLPKPKKPKQMFPVLYILPVEPNDGTRWGNGLDEILELDLHNRYGLICVAPTFSQLPWYADHPTDNGIRQESHFVKVVVPYIERQYPTVSGRKGRLLVGFSKSGWGAFSLLLRHPDLFDRAAAWDAPLAEAEIRRFGMGPIFATKENFEPYCILDLLDKRHKQLGPKPRLMLTGAANFRPQHITVHQKMQSLEIPHIYRDGPKRPHHWSSGWLPEAIEQLTARSE